MRPLGITRREGKGRGGSIGQFFYCAYQACGIHLRLWRGSTGSGVVRYFSAYGHFIRFHDLAAGARRLCPLLFGGVALVRLSFRRQIYPYGSAFSIC